MSDPLGGKGAAPGKGPIGHWAQMAGLGCFLALVQQSTCPRSLALAPSRLKDSIPPNPSLPAWRTGETIRAAEGDPMFVLLGCQVPRAVCSFPVVPLQPGMRGRLLQGHLRPSVPPHRSSILSVQFGTPSSGSRGSSSTEPWEGSGSWGGRKGPLGSENSQETQYWEQQQ